MKKRKTKYKKFDQMIRKLKKHGHILLKRLKKDSEAKKLKSVGNLYLNKIYDSITKAKTNNFSSEDLNNFKKCEEYRNKLLASEEIITYEIFNSNKKALVKDICEKAASSKNWCKLVYALVKQSASSSVFEVGTNLGVSGTYILNALKENPKRNFISLEGLPQLCKISINEFKKVDPEEKFKVWQGLYDDTFDKSIAGLKKIDCCFIDGNHQYAPTLEYFEKLEPLIIDKGIIIFDDINWSKGMQKAWKQIQKSDKLNFTIDLYEIGIAIIDREHHGPKESFAFHYGY